MLAQQVFYCTIYNSFSAGPNCAVAENILWILFYIFQLIILFKVSYFKNEKRQDDSDLNVKKICWNRN